MRRLEGDGEAVELEVDEVAGGVAGLAAGGDVGAAGLLDGDGDCEVAVLVWLDYFGGWDRKSGTYGRGRSGSWRR